MLALGGLLLAGAAHAGEPLPEMVQVPAGRFVMGEDRAETMRDGEVRSSGPPREVVFARGFALSRTEVTHSQFAAFVAESGYEPAADCAGSGNAEDGAQPVSWRDPGLGKPPRDDEPVVCVSWHDARAYAAWLATRTGKPYRLPSEAEWEYAARSGKAASWPWGEDVSDICRQANVPDRTRAALTGKSGFACSDGFSGIAPVGALQANAWGLHDMIGNVWEWVQDCSVLPYPADAPSDGSAIERPSCEKRAVRGGSWRSRLSRQRPTFRGRDPAQEQSQIFGFRVAMTLPEAPD